MPLRWKVVKKSNRTSCKVSNGSKYCYNYPKGKVVKARKETEGIMTFKTKKEAQTFIDDYFHPHFDAQILKVKGIGRGKKPERMCHCGDVSQAFECLLKGDKAGIRRFFCIAIAPRGTLCYKSVKVLT